MTDANQQAQELARTMAQLNQDMALYGRATEQTMTAQKDAHMKAKYGIDNFSAGTASAAKALEGLGGAAIAGMKAMAEGKKGAAAFNGAMDELATSATAAGAALALLVPGGILIKGLIAGVTAATVGLIKYNQMTLDMVDKLHKGYQGMARAGGAAADGMTGVFDDAKKLGLSMGELDSFVQLVAENASDFATFAGSVSDGRKRMADLGQELQSSRTEFFNMGMRLEDVNAGMAGYIKLQSRVGQTQNKTTAELAESTKKYLYEQDALTKLTGMTRQDQEKSREEIRSQERFAAKLEEVRQTRGEAAAKALEDTYLILKSKSKDAAQGFADLSTGMITTEAARKQNMTDQGASLEQSRRIIDGQQTSAGAAQEIAKVSGETAKRFGTSLALMGANNNVMSDYAGSLALGAAAAGDGIEKAAKKIDEDQKKQASGVDGLTASQSALYNTQIKANEKMERMMLSNAESAQAFAQTLANASDEAATQLKRLADTIIQMLGFTGDVKPVSQANTEQDDANWAKANVVEKASSGLARGIESVGDMIGNVVGLGSEGGGNFFKNMANRAREERIASETQYMKDKESGALEHRAAGGPVNRSTPYLVGENGPEIFVPKDAGDIVPNSRLGAGAAIGDNFSAAIDEMFKDVKKQEKTLDVDTVRQKQFSDLQKQYFDTYGGFMKDVIEQVDDNDPKDSSSTIGRMFSGMMGMFGGGGGLQMPKASNIMGMGGGQGLQATSQSDLAKMGLNIKSGDVQAGGAGISPKLIEMAKAIQGGVPGFGYFSAFNDRFHQENASSSKHTQGLAADFTTAQAPSAQDGKQITNWLKQMGASLAIDEYNNPSSKATAGHFHVEIPAFEDGGNLGAGKIGIAGENGKPELVTGPASITPNTDIMGAFNAMNGLLAQSVVKLDDLLRAQKDNNDISNKMLRAQS